MAPETQLLERARWSITQAMLTATDHSTALSAPLRSTETKPDSVTTPWAIPRSFRNINGAANTAVGDLALENNDATGDGDANFNMAVGASALLNNVNGE